MNKLLVILLACLCASSFTPGSEAISNLELITSNNELEMKPALIHTVYFWTKASTTETQMEDFERGLIKLGTCPQIETYYWGPPAPTEARGVVDNSYNYAINVHFASVEKEIEYQTEPIHLAFIKAHQDIWEKVIVYDNIVK